MRMNLTLTVALLLSSLPLPVSAAPAPAPLFDAPAAALASPAGVASSRATVRWRPATSRLDVLVSADGSPALHAGDRVTLNLFDDASFTMIVTEVDRHPGAGLAWAGTLDGIDLGFAALAVSDGALAGRVSTGEAVYRIGHASDGAQVIEEVDTAALPRERDAVPPTAPEPGDTETVAGDAASQIDVAVFYTAAARKAAGGTAGMRSQAALAVATSNQAYLGNELPHRLRLVFVGESALVESNAFGDNLDRLTADATVGWLRNVTRADLVSLLVDYGQNATACGIAWLLTTNSVSFAPSGFSVVERDCASSNLSFPHELGHNMGAHHDLYVATGDHTLDAYSHGFVDLTGKFRTIMAYNDQCAAASPAFNCQRIGLFSTPNKSFGGRVVGNAATADNARTLGETGNTVANFRQALASPLTINATVNQLAFPVGSTLVTSVSLNHSGGVAGTADFYAALVLSDGTAVFLTGLPITATSGYAVGNVNNFASYRPIATGIPLGGPFTANLPNFFAYPRGAGDPTGGFAWVVFAVKSGPITATTFTSDQLLAASVAPFAFPAGTPADPACAGDCAR
jgi:peptidyl-Asp metalloendopeptidase